MLRLSLCGRFWPHINASALILLPHETCLICGDSIKRYCREASVGLGSQERPRAGKALEEKDSWGNFGNAWERSRSSGKRGRRSQANICLLWRMTVWSLEQFSIGGCSSCFQWKYDFHLYTQLIVTQRTVFNITKMYVKCKDLVSAFLPFAVSAHQFSFVKMICCFNFNFLKAAG